MTENPVVSRQTLKAINDARINAYRVVSENDFYPLQPVDIPDTSYTVPEIAATAIEYILTGTPTNGVSVHFEPGAQMDGNKMTVLSFVTIGIKGIGDDLELLPDEVIERICELDRLQSEWTESHRPGVRL